MDRPFIPPASYLDLRPRPSSIAHAFLRGAVAVVLIAGLAWASLRPVPQAAPPIMKVDAKAKAKKAVVPFVMLPTNHMLVKARINGEGPYNLIFDLGAPITLLNNRASESSGVVKNDAPRSFLFGMRGEAEIDKLQAGEMTVTKLPVIVFDHPILKALEDMVGRKIDGIMGFTLFARFKTTIDYQANQMTFEPVDFEVRDLLKDLQDRMMAPRVAKHKVLAPLGVWGIRLGTPTGGIDAPGVPIAAVVPGSPAEKGGLKVGDVITTLDGRWTASVEDVYAAAADAEPGRAADVIILRDGKEMTVSVTAAEGA
jgi:PDZ domain/Aspartyl protease